MYCQLLLLVLPHLPYGVSADQFTNPSNDENDLSQTFTLGENVTITWTTALTNINLRVTHWDMEDEIVIGVLLTEQPNTGVYQWTIGEGDNIDAAEIERSSKFALRLSSGKFVIFILDIVIYTNITDHHFFLFNRVSYTRYYYRSPG
ncbi:hypothetical protein DBV05_g12129 [Lasiodiplodia theobromae]|uniref:Uncharacterized protein n=1 Tax=Lasiodiplodia theobromae TaxID=45133 RepID=A0A5N5CV27_9PEZI|nr:hypothetical protein DBV05_g12129 [Lasiodiplodia theobromae]